MGSICSTGELLKSTPQQPVTPTQRTSDKSIQTLPPNPSVEYLDQILSNEKQTRKSSLALILTILKSYKSTILKQFWDNWKETLFTAITIIPQISEIQYYQESPQAEVQVTAQHLQEAREKISFDEKITLRESPLFVHIDLAKKSAEQPMALSSLFRFFEEMMDKKHEVDLANLASGLDYLSIPEYFLEYLLKIYGLKKLANKSMLQMLLTLKQLNDQDHEYGKFICKLLQIYDPSPISNKLAAFVAKVRIEMNKVISAKKAKSKKMEEIHLVDAVELVYELLPTDKFARSKAVSLMKPKNMADEEFLLFRIYDRMVRMEISTESLFNQIDVEGEKRISLARLVEFLMKKMEIVVQENDIPVLSQIFNLKHSSKIPKYLFLARLAVKTPVEYSADESLAIPKSTFLSTFIKVFNFIQIRDISYLTALFKSLKKVKISKSEFSDLLHSLDSTLSQENCFKYYEESLLLNSDFSLDGVLQDSFIKTVLVNNIGQKGTRDFCK